MGVTPDVELVQVVPREHRLVARTVPRNMWTSSRGTRCGRMLAGGDEVDALLELRLAHERER